VHGNKKTSRSCRPALGVGGKVIRDYSKILAVRVQNSSARTLTLIRVCSLEQSRRAYGRISRRAI